MVAPCLYCTSACPTIRLDALLTSSPSSTIHEESQPETPRRLRHSPSSGHSCLTPTRQYTQVTNPTSPRDAPVTTTRGRTHSAPKWRTAPRPFIDFCDQSRVVAVAAESAPSRLRFARAEYVGREHASMQGMGEKERLDA